MSAHENTTAITEQVNDWLNQVVIGLNLCPFAAKPQRNKQIKIHVSHAQSEEALLEDISICCHELERTPVAQLETTLVVVPAMFTDFYEYNRFIDWIDALFRQEQWEGIYQVATFHPDYCFANTEADDPANLTNRAPYPIFHLIREESIERVLQYYPDPESIPETNIKRVSALSEQEKLQLFPHLFHEQS